MNAEEILGIDPYGQTNRMLRLSGEENTPYRLRNCVKLAGEYTFAIWCKASASSKVYLTIFENQYEEPVGTEWKKIKETAEIDDLSRNYIDIQITPGIEFYFYEAMLQAGDYDTDWKYAPEDVKGMTDAALAEAYNYSLQQSAELRIAIDNIAESVNETFVQYDDELQALKTWKSEASEKITANAIVHTVQEANIIAPIAQSYADAAQSAAQSYADEKSGTVLEYAQTIETQTSEKFSWIIKNGTDASNFTLTSRVASLLAAEFEISAITTFISAAGNGSSTVIDGGAIKTNSITAAQLNVTDLFAVAAKIGAFSIQETSLFTGEKNEFASTADGVYIGADGIALGAGFCVNPQGIMEADSARLTGDITIYNKSDARKMMIEDTAFTFYVEENKRFASLSYDACRTGQATDDEVTAVGFQLSESIFTIGHGVTIKVPRPSPGGMGYICNPDNIPIPGLDPDGTYTHRFTGRTQINGWLDVGDVYGINAGQIYASTVVQTPKLLLEEGGSVREVVDDVERKVIECVDSNRLFFGSTYYDICLIGSSITSNNAISVTSDQNRKHAVEDMDERYLSLLFHLPPRRFKYNDDQSGGYHMGYIAQELEACMQLYGISDDEFCALVRHPDGMSIRYGEITALNTLGIQYLNNMLVELAKTVNSLQEKGGEIWRRSYQPAFPQV